MESDPLAYRYTLSAYIFIQRRLHAVNYFLPYCFDVVFVDKKVPNNLQLEVSFRLEWPLPRLVDLRKEIHPRMSVEVAHIYISCERVNALLLISAYSFYLNRTR